jgi:hypothetical protein
MPGFPGVRTTRPDVDRKFRSNVGEGWPRKRGDTILQALWALDRTDN